MTARKRKDWLDASRGEGRMTLRTKIIAMTLAGFTIVLLLTFVVSQNILMKRFADLESEDTAENTQRAISALYTDFSTINITFGPAVFDSRSFAWVEDERGAHLEISFDGRACGVLNIDYIAFILTPGQPPTGTGYDRATAEPIPFPDRFAEELMRPDSPLAQPPQTDNTSVTGILVLPDVCLLVQSFPISVTTSWGAIEGRTIFARVLSEAEVSRLAEQTHLSLELVRWDDEDLPSDMLAAQRRLSDESPLITTPLSRDSVAGYGLLTDVYGNPALILRADMPRDVYHEGQQTVFWLVAIITTIAAAFIIALIVLMNWVVLSRLLGLNRSINSVREAGNVTARIAVQGRDEISGLGQAINGMLASLERGQRELSEREAEKRALLNAVPDLMFRVAADGTIIDARAAEKGEQAQTQVRFSEGKLYREMPQYDALSAEVVRRGMPLVKQALKTGQTQTFEIQVPLKGDTAFYEARVAASRENEALVMVRDVTERKRAEMRLEFVSSHDALSGLHNRAYFESEFARMERSGGPFPVSVIMVDVDGLKAVNDTLGHVAGDALLRRTATVLLATFRSGDVVSRIGGDEFAVLLPGADESVVEKAMERLRKTLAIHNSEHRGSALSFSLGAATGYEGCQLTEVMREADNRMYQDKQAKKAAARLAGSQPSQPVR